MAAFDFRLSWTWWSVLPVAIVAAACLAAASPALTQAWQFDRAAVAAGELWRLLTGHLTHWSLNHLFWDAATFLGLSLACIRWRHRRTLACILSSAVAISATVLVAHPELHTYRGLSGIDTALFILLAVNLWQSARLTGDRALAAVVFAALAGFAGKTSYELLTGGTLFVDVANAPFIPLASAHAMGALIGALAALWPPLRWRAPHSPSLRTRNTTSGFPRR
jgi:rhomboid family GlyGly-CTERM serine protease